MSRDKCLIDASAALSKLSGSDSVNELTKLVKQTIDDAEVSGKNVREVIQAMSEEYTKTIAWHKTQQAMTVIKFEEVNQFMAQFKDSRAQGLKALFRTDNSRDYKSNGTIERRKSSVKNEAISILMQTTNRHDGLEARLFAGELDDDLLRALHPKNKGKDLGLGKDVLELAEAIKKINNISYQKKVDIGFATRFLDDYVAPQKWDFDDMLKLGDTPEVAKANWKVLAKETFDWDRMRKHSDQIDEYLEDFWDKRSNKNLQNKVDVDNEFEEISLNLVSERMGK